MRTIALVLLSCWLAAAQPKPPSVQTKGACSPIVTGNGNKITIKTCGMTDNQVDEWRASFKQILEKQIDPKVLVALLDDIKSGQIRIEKGVLQIERGVRQIQANQGWTDLTAEQLSVITEAARPFAGRESVIDVPYWERDTERLARQLSRALTDVGWSAPVEGQGQMRLYPPNANLPKGITIEAKENSPALLAIANALFAVFGQGSFAGNLNAQLPPGLIKITVWRKP